MNSSESYWQLFQEKLLLFKSLLSSEKFHQISAKKPEVSTFFDAQSSSLFARSEKTLAFPRELILQFLFSGYKHHYLIDERQGKTTYMSSIAPELHILHYFLPSPNRALLEDQEMFLLNGFKQESDSEFLVVGFSAEFEELKDKERPIPAMKSQLNGYRIIEMKDATCKVSHIVSRNYRNRLPSFVNFDWNQGGHLEKLEWALEFIPQEELALGDEHRIDEIDGIIKTALKENPEKKDKWIDKYEEVLKPSPEEFENVEKVDLFNLFGEPYKPKIGKAKRALQEPQAQLPKSMVGKVQNTRTKDYLANLMGKVKK